jgi:hypothetical protein
MVSADVAAALSSPLSVIEEIYDRISRQSDKIEQQIIEHFRDLLWDRIDEVSNSVESNHARV